jgi:hypothetical protein
LKDLEVLASLKAETSKRPTPKAPTSSEAAVPGEPEKEASPKRTPRFSKKPKVNQSPDA